MCPDLYGSASNRGQSKFDDEVLKVMIDTANGTKFKDSIGPIKRGMAMQIANDIFHRDANGYSMPLWRGILALFKDGMLMSQIRKTNLI